MPFEALPQETLPILIKSILSLETDRASDEDIKQEESRPSFFRIFTTNAGIINLGEIKNSMSIEQVLNSDSFSRGLNCLSSESSSILIIH